MFSALKASNRKPKICSRKVWKSLNADMSTFKYPGPRTLPLEELPKVLLAGTPKAQGTLRELMVAPACVQGVADGSVPNQLLMLRCTIFSGRYTFARGWPWVFELVLSGEVRVSGNPE